MHARLALQLSQNRSALIAPVPPAASCRTSCSTCRRTAVPWQYLVLYSLISAARLANDKSAPLACQTYFWGRNCRSEQRPPRAAGSLRYRSSRKTAYCSRSALLCASKAAVRIWPAFCHLASSVSRCRPAGLGNCVGACATESQHMRLVDKKGVSLQNS